MISKIKIKFQQIMAIILHLMKIQLFLVNLEKNGMNMTIMHIPVKEYKNFFKVCLRIILNINNLKIKKIMKKLRIPD